MTFLWYRVDKNLNVRLTLIYIGTRSEFFNKAYILYLVVSFYYNVVF